MIGLLSKHAANSNHVAVRSFVLHCGIYIEIMRRFDVAVRRQMDAGEIRRGDLNSRSRHTPRHARASGHPVITASEPRAGLRYWILKPGNDKGKQG
jgi:hypothetical protein